MATVVLVAATVAVGLVAGLFAGFSYAVMPGLRAADDRTLVVTMRRVNEAIVNPLFLAVFLGAPLLTALAVVLHAPSAQRGAVPWLVAGLLLYLLSFGVTVGRNIPLNNQLAAAGDPDRAADLPGVRRRFEGPWTRWNLVRAVAATAACGCLAAALAAGG